MVGAGVGAGVTGATGEGVELLEHAANTRTAVDSNPIKRFDIDILPVGYFPLQQGRASVQACLPFRPKDNLGLGAKTVPQSGGLDLQWQHYERPPQECQNVLRRNVKPLSPPFGRVRVPQNPGCSCSGPPDPYLRLRTGPRSLSSARRSARRCGVASVGPASGCRSSPASTGSAVGGRRLVQPADG